MASLGLRVGLQVPGTTTQACPNRCEPGGELQACDKWKISPLLEVIRIDSLDLIHGSRRDANSVIHHQLCQLLPIDQADGRIDPRGELAGLLGEA